jgi:hypothetical protein
VSKVLCGTTPKLPAKEVFADLIAPSDARRITTKATPIFVKGKSGQSGDQL